MFSEELTGVEVLKFGNNDKISSNRENVETSPKESLEPKTKLFETFDKRIFNSYI